MVGKEKKGKKKVVKPAKIFIYALSLAAITGGAYLTYDRLRRRKLLNDSEESQDVITTNDNFPVSYNTSSSSISRKSGAKGTDNFPLKRGSRGTMVTMLQQALAKKLGDPTFKVYGGIDGQFGAGTVKALKKAGFADTIDEVTFNKITGRTNSSDLHLIFNPVDIAARLYKAVQARDIETVLSQLRQIKTVTDYSSVNGYYKKQSFISKTIVTDLLDFAFKGNEEAKGQIRNEFLRIGLKTDPSGKWSLQGIPLYKDLITLRETLVIDVENNRIPVKRNTILGDEVRVQNGITWFRSIDNRILKVPTQDVKYT
jgi:hypothetical protein